MFYFRNNDKNRIFADEFLKHTTMKKLMLFVLLAVGSLATQAQHLEFKGHPITGKLADFVALLEKDGFKTYGTSLCKNAADKKKLQDNRKNMLQKHLYVMEGAFLDKAVEITIGASQSDTVYMVFVDFDDCVEEWNIIVRSFSRVESLLSEKYGEPYSKKTGSEFSNALKFLALSQDKMVYMSMFELNTGSVLLAIVPCKNDYRRVL